MVGGDVRPAAGGRKKSNVPAIAVSVAAAVLVVAMALSTKVVKIGSSASGPTGSVSGSDFGTAQFPKIQGEIVRRAVPAAVLAAALAKNSDAASKQYGVKNDSGVEFCVKFTGVVGAGDSGNDAIAVPGLPKSVVVQVQTGPAILGTDLRDATGTVDFGAFTNQIEYQNAGSALNKAMKKAVLAKLDTATLKGKTVDVVGAFAFTDPKLWLVTPATLAVK